MPPYANSDATYSESEVPDCISIDLSQSPPKSSDDHNPEGTSDHNDPENAEENLPDGPRGKPKKTTQKKYLTTEGKNSRAFQSNRLAFNARIDTMEIPVHPADTMPSKPKEESGDLSWTYLCGILDDEQPPKNYKKSGKKLTMAGTPFNMEEKSVVFTKDKKTSLKTKAKKIKALNEKEKEQYVKDMKDWEKRFVLWAYHNKFGIFPRELKSSSQLGDKNIDEDDTNPDIPTEEPSRCFCSNCVCERCINVRDKQKKDDNPDSTIDQIMDNAGVPEDFRARVKRRWKAAKGKQ
ncbi:MAG: hypothetical protein M1816_004013 [Peltula sp. TS41687]|nr:MAG: hypothetical protein M1816_004013 [Peltula sp. TS41687]